MGSPQNIDKARFNSNLLYLMASFSKEFQQLGQTCAAKILTYVNDGMPAVKAVDLAMNEVHFILEYENILKQSLLTAVAIGYGILPSALAQPSKIIKTLMSDAWADDKMKLSKRLHGVAKKMRDAIVDTVGGGMRNLKTFKEIGAELSKGYERGSVINQAELPKYLADMEKIARKVANGDKELMKPLQAAIDKASKIVDKLSQNHAPTKELKTAYKALIEAAKTFEVDALDRTVNLAVNEKSRYYAERIARTEMSRAFSDSVFADTLQDEDVIGYRWRLSSNHPRFDICDLHANADFYGLGAGVYPKSAYPRYPAHPHCRCSPTPVYSGMLDSDEAKKYSEERVKDWIDSLNDEEQKQLFGAGGKEEYAKTGNIKLSKNWSGHEAPSPKITAEMIEDVTD